jgi:anthranilate phosphoribosyltransferase
MIFSGGGNDIVADPMALWIRDFDPVLAPGDHVHAQRFGAALAVVAAGLADNMQSGIQLAEAAIDSGGAVQTLERLRTASRQ